EPSLLHTKASRDEERRAADRLNQGFDDYCLGEAHLRAEKIERQPDFQRRQETLQRLPEEQIAQYDRPSAPDQLDGPIDLCRLPNQRTQLASSQTIERARDSGKGTHVRTKCEHN